MCPYRYLHSSLCAYVMNLFNRVFAILLHTGNKTPPMTMMFYIFSKILCITNSQIHLYLCIVSKQRRTEVLVFCVWTAFREHVDN